MHIFTDLLQLAYGHARIFVSFKSSYLNGPNMLRLSLQEHIANSNNLILSNTNFDIELETEWRVNHNNTTPVIEWERFSSWRKLVRYFTWIKLESVPSILNSDLLKDSARVIILLILSERFSMEVKHIRNNFPVPNNSKLQQLNPIISENVLKGNGRLKHSNWTTELKHLIILPGDHHITQNYYPRHSWEFIVLRKRSHFSY